MVIFFYLFVHGIPALIAAIPGFWALGDKRPLLGWLVIAGAFAVTIPFAIISDRMRTRAMTEAGLIADDWPVMLVTPFFFGVLYLIAAAIVCAVFALVIRRRDRPVG